MFYKFCDTHYAITLLRTTRTCNAAQTARAACADIVADVCSSFVSLSCMFDIETVSIHT